MALILSIDTSTKVCSVALFEDQNVIAYQVYHLQKSHSSLLPGIVEQLVVNAGFLMSQLDAVAISGGPGSYTGLRIGTSAAKGLCFGLDIPLIAYDSLDALSEQVVPLLKSGDLVCAMIDARRMEVFCDLKSAEGEKIWPSQPVILDETTFDEFPEGHLYLVGNGATKCKELFVDRASGITFLEEYYPAAYAIGRIVSAKFQAGDFVDLAYFEPEYLKEYRVVPSKKKLL